MEQRIVIRQSSHVCMSMIINWEDKYIEFDVSTLNEGYTYDADKFSYAARMYEELEKKSLK